MTETTDLTEIRNFGALSVETLDGTTLTLSGGQDAGYVLEINNTDQDVSFEADVTAEQLQKLQLVIAALLTQR